MRRAGPGLRCSGLLRAVLDATPTQWTAVSSVATQLDDHVHERLGECGGLLQYCRDHPHKFEHTTKGVKHVVRRLSAAKLSGRLPVRAAPLDVVARANGMTNERLVSTLHGECLEFGVVRCPTGVEYLGWRGRTMADRCAGEEADFAEYVTHEYDMLRLAYRLRCDKPTALEDIPTEGISQPIALVVAAWPSCFEAQVSEDGVLCGVTFVLPEEAKHLLKPHPVLDGLSEDEMREQVRQARSFARIKLRRKFLHVRIRREFPQGNPHLHPAVSAMHLFDLMEGDTEPRETHRALQLLPHGGTRGCLIDLDFFRRFPHLFRLHSNLALQDVVSRVDAPWTKDIPDVGRDEVALLLLSSLPNVIDPTRAMATSMIGVRLGGLRHDLEKCFGSKAAFLREFPRIFKEGEPGFVYIDGVELKAEVSRLASKAGGDKAGGEKAGGGKDSPGDGLDADDPVPG